MAFQNRAEAAQGLVHVLDRYRGKHPLVLAIPRGAVPMGRVIANALGGDLDVALVRKLGAPGNAEFAVGAVDESGWTIIVDHAAAMGANPAYLDTEKAAQLAVLRQRRVEYTSVRPPLDPAGRLVIVIDDGLATGATMLAALHAVGAKSPAKLVVAVPVAPISTLKKVKALVDELVCLLIPANFATVGQFYQDFPAVSDAQVIAALRAQ